MIPSIAKIVLLLLLVSIRIEIHAFSSLINTRHHEHTVSSSVFLENIPNPASFMKSAVTNNQYSTTLLMSSKSNSNNNDDDDVDGAINDLKFNKKQQRKSRENDGDDDNNNDNETLSKEDIVKAVGETFRRRKQTNDDNDDPAATTTTDEESSSSSLLDRINPFKAGQTLRKTIDETINEISSAVTSDPTQSKYYIDESLDRSGTIVTTGTSTSQVSMKGKSLSDMAKILWEQDDYIPEVLVVGASGEVGRLIVKRLTLTGRCRVRVLVRDLYTKTLNMFGTSVTYCQGDLNNIDSLQYAVTDIDKLIFCATPPQPDEEQFRTKFNEYVQENLGTTTTTGTTGSTTNDNEWEQLESVLDVRAKLAEQVDCIGIQNLVRAYQDVRHADYGTSQAAKRSLFKFEKDRPDDFYLFSINNEDDSSSAFSRNDDDDENDDDYEYDKSSSGIKFGTSSSSSNNDYNIDDEDEYDKYDTEEYNYDNYKDDEEYGTMIEQRNADVAVKVQTQWIPNRFFHGVFVGRVPSAGSLTSSTSTGGSGSGTASIISTRLRSRDDPENGIDLGGTSTSSSAAPFAGFIVRLCADGGTYEAFIRTSLYPEYNIEYVCEFSTATKTSSTIPIPNANAADGDNNSNTNIINKSKNKFITIRLPFESFKAVRHTTSGNDNDDTSFTSNTIPPFKGRDVQHIGFRYRASKNTQQQSKRVKNNDWSKFYLSLSYIKLYRSQPEPEVIYLSDARIPAVVRDGMVKHNSRRLVLSSSSLEDSGDVGNNNVLVDDTTFKQAAITKKAMTDSKLVKAIGRSPEEIYYKYRGEEIVKKSGLSYAIVRVTGFNEISSGEASTIDVSSIQPPNLINTANNNNDITTTYVSRDEIAQVCVNALLDPNALNKSFYVTKKSLKEQQQKVSNIIINDDTEMASKFASLSADVIA